MTRNVDDDDDDDNDDTITDLTTNVTSQQATLYIFKLSFPFLNLNILSI